VTFFTRALRFSRYAPLAAPPTGETTMDKTLKLARTSLVRLNSGIRAGGSSLNHNQPLLRASIVPTTGETTMDKTLKLTRTSLIRLNSGIKAGGATINHNQHLL
jgi:hypothetical protein